MTICRLIDGWSFLRLPAYRVPGAVRAPKSRKYDERIHIGINGSRTRGYNRVMGKAKDEHENEREDEKSAAERHHEHDSADDESSPDETKRFERSDNLRRRAEWFQKRTSGG
jgi:hypothetical protein